MIYQTTITVTDPSLALQLENSNDEVIFVDAEGKEIAKMERVFHGAPTREQYAKAPWRTAEELAEARKRPTRSMDEILSEIEALKRVRNPVG